MKVRFLTNTIYGEAGSVVERPDSDTVFIDWAYQNKALVNIITDKKIKKVKKVKKVDDAISPALDLKKGIKNTQHKKEK